MNFFLLGIDYKAAPIEVREYVYWRKSEIAGAWHEGSILSTCNRFEIYDSAKDPFEAADKADEFKKAFKGLFDNAYIIYGERNIFNHLTRLAAGLESQITGELQIFDQISAWAGRDDTPEGLRLIARDALIAARRIRAMNGFNDPNNNIAVRVYDDILSASRSDRLPDLVVAGTGNIAELFAQYRPGGVRVSFAAHKNILKAQRLAAQSGGQAFLLKDLPRLLSGADVFVSATSSPHRVFGKNYFAKIAATRREALHVYDLAVPRDIDPGVKELGGIILKNIDEVVFNGKIESRNKAEPVSV